MLMFRFLFMYRLYFFFFFLSNWDGAPMAVGALRKLRTLHIGSSGTSQIDSKMLNMFAIFTENRCKNVTKQTC